MPSSNSPAPPVPDGATDVARPPSDASVSPSRRKLARESSGGADLKKAKTYSELQGAFSCPHIHSPPVAKMLGLGSRQASPPGQPPQPSLRHSWLAKYSSRGGEACCWGSWLMSVLWLQPPRMESLRPS